MDKVPGWLSIRQRPDGSHVLTPAFAAAKADELPPAELLDSQFLRSDRVGAEKGSEKWSKQYAEGVEHASRARVGKFKAPKGKKGGEAQQAKRARLAELSTTVEMRQLLQVRAQEAFHSRVLGSRKNELTLFNVWRSFVMQQGLGAIRWTLLGTPT